MDKVQIAYGRLTDILVGGARQWRLDALLREANWTLYEPVGMTTMRKAVARLPSRCVIREGGKLIVAARHCAKSDETIDALIAHGMYDRDVPVRLHEDVLRKALVLADDWALYQSLRWASPGVYQIMHTGYGLMLRWQY